MDICSQGGPAFLQAQNQDPFYFVPRKHLFSDGFINEICVFFPFLSKKQSLREGREFTFSESNFHVNSSIN